MIQIPIKYTDFNKKGGWRWLAEPIKWRQGVLLWYPAYISENDIWGPGAIAERRAKELAAQRAKEPIIAHTLRSFN